MKLYEQFDFEDLSDEELFGEKEKDLVLGKHKSRFYVLVPQENDMFTVYCGGTRMYPKSMFSFNSEIDYDTRIRYTSVIVYRGAFHRRLNYTKWGDLDPEIKERIKI